VGWIAVVAKIWNSKAFVVICGCFMIFGILAFIADISDAPLWVRLAIGIPGILGSVVVSIKCF